MGAGQLRPSNKSPPSPFMENEIECEDFELTKAYPVY
jgi:hypothetical protein